MISIYKAWAGTQSIWQKIPQERGYRETPRNLWRIPKKIEDIPTRKGEPHVPIGFMTSCLVLFTPQPLRLHENFLQLVGHYVWPSWGSSSDISGFGQSFYTENEWRTWFSSPVIFSSDTVPFNYRWTFCLTIQGLVVRHFQNSSDMSDESDGFREAWPLLTTMSILVNWLTATVKASWTGKSTPLYMPYPSIFPSSSSEKDTTKENNWEKVWLPPVSIKYLQIVRSISSPKSVRNIINIKILHAVSNKILCIWCNTQDGVCSKSWLSGDLWYKTLKSNTSTM